MLLTDTPSETFLEICQQCTDAELVVLARTFKKLHDGAVAVLYKSLEPRSGASLLSVVTTLVVHTNGALHCRRLHLDFSNLHRYPFPRNTIDLSFPKIWRRLSLPKAFLGS